MEFMKADASEGLPFTDGSYDSVISFDSINHIANRNKLLKEIYRVLKPGGFLLYTDPIVVTGILTSEEIAVRSSIGYFLFVPLGENERLLKEAGFENIASKDVTENIAMVSEKWYEARRKRKKDLDKLEDENTYDGLQSFFKMVYTVSSEKRLSRILYSAVKP
jgi:SAM-dependent methyltransferase